MTGVAATTAGGAGRAALVERRLAGEPLQYVLGHWAFRTLDLVVDRRALIPRPETEQVVEVALAELRRSGCVATGPGPVVVDLGTGTGAIALSLADRARPGARGLGHRRRPRRARRWPRQNLGPRGVGRPGAAERVRLAAGSWFEALPADLRGRLDLRRLEPAVRERGGVGRPRSRGPATSPVRRWWPGRRDGTPGWPRSRRSWSGGRGGWPRRGRWWSRWLPTRPPAALDVAPAGRAGRCPGRAGPGRSGPDGGGPPVAPRGR